MRAGRYGKALSLAVVLTVALSGVFALALAMAPTAQAGQCDQVSGVITGDWTITTPQTCSGIVYTVDGNIIINSGGSLDLINGGLVFNKDGSHTAYSLNVNAGGSLILDGSFVATQTNSLNPYLFLNLNVASATNGVAASFSMKNGAYLKFPGWFNATASAGGQALVNITGSTITGFTDQEISGIYSPGTLGADLNDDAPVMAFSGARVTIFQSSLRRLYESETNTFNAKNIAFTLGATLSAYDTFIGVDFSNSASIHNALTVDGTSFAYLYNVTVDTTQNPSSQLSWQPAFVPSGAGAIYFFRWMHGTALDDANHPIPGATIWSRVSPTSTTAQYPDSGMTTVPASLTLWYLRRTASSWNTTDASGTVLIPLYTDSITVSTLPNAASFGSYQETGRYQTYLVSQGVFYSPYPQLSAASNNAYVNFVFTPVVVCPGTITRWSGPLTISGGISVSGTLEIASGTVTINAGSLYIDQAANACGYVKVDSGATLAIISSAVSSNYPLVIDVASGAAFTATRGSSLALSVMSPGLLRSTGTAAVTLADTTVTGNVTLAGASASLVRDTFYGPALSLSTATTTKLWDANLPGVTTLAFTSASFDIRNTSFNQAQTSQLVFGNGQTAQLTNVQLYDPTNTWYLTMVTGTASVSRYWWLTVNAVDGTGALLAEANATIYLWRMDPVTAKQVPLVASDVGAGNVYYAASTTVTSTQSYFTAPAGSIVLRAYQGTWTAAGHFVNDTYLANGSASPQGTVYGSDASVQAVLSASASVRLTFTSLTPDLSVPFIQVSGLNQVSNDQPIKTNITLTATVRNTGQISVKNAIVAFYSTNVDLNGDHIMDAPTSAYASALIAWITVPLVPKNGTILVPAYWTPVGSSSTNVPISVVVNPPVGAPSGPGAIPETDMTNNLQFTTARLFTWPDLSVSSTDILPLSDPVVGNAAPIQVTIHNFGTSGATQATVQLFEAGAAVSNQVSFSIGVGDVATQILTWTPPSVGGHSLVVLVNTRNDTIQNKDYHMLDNVATASLTVHTQPDLALYPGDYPTNLSEPQATPFPFEVFVHNLGQTAAYNVTVAVFLDGNRSFLLGHTDGITVLAGSQKNATVQLQGIPTVQIHTLMVVADPDNRIHEGNEANNFANVTVNVLPPQGTVYIGSPGPGLTFAPGEQVNVQGAVRDSNLNGIGGLTLTIAVLSNGVVVPGGSHTVQTNADGSFRYTLDLTGFGDGGYMLRINSTSTKIAGQEVPFGVKANVPFLNQPVPLIGLQWWIFLVILAAVVAALVGVTLYFKVFGLGKMVECGECGAFIPEDATTCPKCGVEFEKDMAKCSNCQAWIPVDVKQCPECGVEFATGQVEMADYQEKMRLQYDEVVQKFKEDASRQLGRTLSDKEFQEWWRKQPTFVTFEDWLREEEEMRKMGSRPCPVCGTLNSVTATVCHKCGSLMKQQEPPKGGAGGAVAGAPPSRRPGAATGPAQPRPPAAGPATQAAAPSAAPESTETIPRRVIRRPIQSPQPMVQKKVVKRPATEGQAAESEGGEETSSEEKTEDEL